jgi:hypothetical protein
VTDDADEDWPRELRFLLERHPRAIWPLASSCPRCAAKRPASRPGSTGSSASMPSSRSGRTRRSVRSLSYAPRPSSQKLAPHRWPRNAMSRRAGAFCERLRRHLKAEEELVVPVPLEYVEH